MSTDDLSHFNFTRPRAHRPPPFVPTSDRLEGYVFNRPLTPPGPPPVLGIVLTKKDLEHPSCRRCYVPIKSGDLCAKHGGTP